MNIAYVSAVFPYPLHSGGQVRIYNLLKRLSKYHDITLYAFIRDSSEKQYCSELSFCKKVIPIYRGRAWNLRYISRSLFSTWPFLYATYDHIMLRALLEVSQKSFDLLHIEPGYVMPSIPDIRVPLVVAEHNIEHSVYDGYVKKFPFTPLRPILQSDVQKMKRMQTVLWNKAASVIAVSDDDALYIRENSTQKSVHVVPNGADLEYFSFTPKKMIKKNQLHFAYIGNFSWIQNSDAIEHILKTVWPVIVQKFPGARFSIVGKHFPDSLKSLLSEAVIILDSVPDIRHIYTQADVLLAPIRIGGGTRYKIIEAMATGLPVITSTLGASGLSLKHLKDVYIADTSSDILHCIDELLLNNKRIALVQSARRYIEKSFSWEKIAARQDACWRSYEKK